MNATKPYKEMLLEQLKDPELAAAYLNEHFQYEGPKAKKLLLNAFKSVLEAQGFTYIAKKTGISRRALYKAFAPTGNPTLQTLHTLLEAIGISLEFTATDTYRKKISRKKLGAS